MPPTPGMKRALPLSRTISSGNVNASHLHFELMDGPSPLESDSLPSELKGFTYEGQVAPELITDADVYLSGTFLQGKLATGEKGTHELPLNLEIIDFG